MYKCPSVDRYAHHHFPFSNIEVHVQHYSFNSLSTMKQWAYSQSNHILNTKWKKNLLSSFRLNAKPTPTSWKTELGSAHALLCNCEALNALCHACCPLCTQCSQNRIRAVIRDEVSIPSILAFKYSCLALMKNNLNLESFLQPYKYSHVVHSTALQTVTAAPLKKQNLRKNQSGRKPTKLTFG